MRKTVIFGGTTEGRILSGRLSRAGQEHILCVAGKYGEEVVKETDHVRIRTGRMEAEEMKDFLTEEGFGEGDLILDATHPYATRVTENIREASDGIRGTYVRILREQGMLSGEEIRTYADITECAKALDHETGNILLTTGSKELHDYCAGVTGEVKQRTYVRVLPSEESLAVCREEGIGSDHIIAMQGPFTEELNRAVYVQYRIRHLVTKDSGKTGGFEEKVKAAGAEHVKVHLIRRPIEEEGFTVEEAWDRYFGELTEREEYLPALVLAGIGMGSEEGMTLAIRKELEEADAVFGAKRLLKDLKVPVKYEMYRASHIIPVLERTRPEKAVILFSGDTGFYSGAKEAAKEFRNWKKGLRIRILPGISSVAALASKLGENYDDALIESLHGRNTSADVDRLLRRISCRDKTFVLLSGADDLHLIASGMQRRGIDGTVFAGTDLSYESERIDCLSPEEALDYSCEGPVTVMIRNPDPEKRPLIPVKGDTDFVRDQVPMTKECIRHESIIRLELKEGDVLYDIGGGTGSVAIESASLDPSVRVTTIEKKPEAADLIRRNIEKAGIGNVTVLEGEASGLLPDLEKPDCVFIGGSGGQLGKILEILHRKGSGIRFVINAVSLDTLAEVSDLLEKYRVRDEKITQLAVSRVEKMGDHRLMRGENPVFIISFTL